MKGKHLAYMLVVFLVVLGAGDVGKANAERSLAQCKEEGRVALNACKPIIYGRLPSPECCERVRVAHMECVCPHITPKVVAGVNVNRAVRLIKGCGRKFPRHYKCGSITIP